MPGPSSLSDLTLPEAPAPAPAPTPVFRRRFALVRPFLRNAYTPTSDDEARLGTGSEFRASLRPPAASDDSASSSSSMDSSSSSTSATSGGGGGATHHERNTRLSLLWTSRLNRGTPRTGAGESPSPPGAGYYDLEERRGEGSVMRGGPAASNRDGDAEHRDLRPLRSLNHCCWASRLLANRTASHGQEGASEEEPGDAAAQHRPPHGWRHSGGQGGRWMYYRGKYPGSIAPSRNNGGGLLRRTSSPGPGPSGASRSGLNRASRGSSPIGRRTQTPLAVEDDSLLAIPGPSGLSRHSADAPASSSSAADPFPPLPSASAGASSDSWSRNQSLLDPHFGVQLLSRHIENMQFICR